MELLANRLIGMSCFAAVGDTIGRGDTLSRRGLQGLVLPLTLPFEQKEPMYDETWHERPATAWGGYTDHFLLGIQTWATLGDRQRHFVASYLERLLHWQREPPSRMFPKLEKELEANMRLRYLDRPGRDSDATAERILMGAAQRAFKTKHFQDVLFVQEMALRYWERTGQTTTATSGALTRPIGVVITLLPLKDKIALTKEIVSLTHQHPFCIAAAIAVTVLLHRVIFDSEPPSQAAREALQTGRVILGADEDLLEEWDSFLDEPETIMLAQLELFTADGHVLRALGVLIWAAFEVERLAPQHRKMLREDGIPIEDDTYILADAGKELMTQIFLERGDCRMGLVLTGALLGGVLTYEGMPLDWLAAVTGRGTLELTTRQCLSRWGLRSEVQPKPINVKRFNFRPHNYVRTAYSLDGQLWYHNRAWESREALEHWADGHYRNRPKGGFNFG